MISHRENDITDVLNETFFVTEDRPGEHVIIGLRLGGATQNMLERDKNQYADLVVVHRIAGRIAAQFRALMEGLWRCYHWAYCECSTSTSWCC